MNIEKELLIDACDLLVDCKTLIENTQDIFGVGEMDLYLSDKIEKFFDRYNEFKLSNNTKE